MDKILRRIAAIGLMSGLCACVTPPAAAPAPSTPETPDTAPASTPQASTVETAPTAAEEVPAAEPAAPAASSGRRAASEWRTNDAAIAIIKASEGLRLDAYQLGSQWLIGYGHAAGVTPSMRITEAQADQFLREDLRDFETSVAMIVTVPVTENEFGALVSLCYNLGAGKFATTTVVAALNKGDYIGAADAFLNHARITVNGVKQQDPHLLERRKKERDLFKTP
ncbi:MAG: lysozyme [Parvularculaceae bacterium]